MTEQARKRGKIKRDREEKGREGKKKRVEGKKEGKEESVYHI